MLACAAGPINAPDRQSLQPRAEDTIELLKPAPASRLHVVDQPGYSYRSSHLLILFNMNDSRSSCTSILRASSKSLVVCAIRPVPWLRPPSLAC